jgi:phage terminase large subunit
LKVRADAGKLRMLYSKHEDNPRMYAGGEWTTYGRTYLARLESLTGARYQRMRWGKWVAAEGLVYETYEPSIHMVDRFDVPRDWTRYWSVDFGFTNPQVFQCWAEDHDGRLYLYREWYRTRRTVDQHAADILSVIAPSGLWLEPRPRVVVCDHDAEGRAVLEREMGIGTVAAHKAVSEGIQAVQQRLRVLADGRPRLYLMRDALVSRDMALVDAKKPACTAEEFAGYVWAVKPGALGGIKEEPVKADDHGMDATRYMIAHRDLGSRPRIRFFG